MWSKVKVICHAGITQNRIAIDDTDTTAAAAAAIP
jgi:hypothetical protein